MELLACVRMVTPVVANIETQRHPKEIDAAFNCTPIPKGGAQLLCILCSSFDDIDSFRKVALLIQWS